MCEPTEESRGSRVLAGEQLLNISPVMPVVTLDDVDQAVPVAEALLRGGVPIIELVLRTQSALKCIERIATELPDMTLGAGTVLTAEQARQAADAGAQFIITPGATDNVLNAIENTKLPCVPGFSTISEAMRLAERGFTTLKFFPAEACGGVEYLRAMAGPLPELRIIPTGSIKPAKVADYLALPNVSCVGGSWLTPKDALAAKDYQRIEALAKEAASLC